MDCAFCAIVAASRPAYRVLETDDVVGFLDVRPVFKGHVLLVPREHHETLADLPSNLLRPLFEQVQRLSGAVVSALGADGSFVAVNNVVSQSVPHLHVHVVPRRSRDSPGGFCGTRTRYVDDT